VEAVVGGDEDAVVIREGPEALVEGPVGVAAEGQAVAGIVVAAVGKLVDVGGLDDAAGVEGRQAVAGRGAGARR